jgi:hypothetical protein
LARGTALPGRVSEVEEVEHVEAVQVIKVHHVVKVQACQCGRARDRAVRG